MHENNSGCLFSEHSVYLLDATQCCILQPSVTVL